LLRIGDATFQPARTFEHARGRVAIYVAPGGAVLTVADGHVVLESSRALTEVCDGLRARAAPLKIFHDWERVTSYDSDARVHLTRWTLSTPRGTIGEVHVLMRSRLVAMGVATAALALRLSGIAVHSYTARAEFERRRAPALR
jgi:hypothetical protein